MIKEVRERFNSEFSEGKYEAFLSELDSETGSKIDFRVAETPIFIPKELKHKIEKAVDEIVSIIGSEDFLKNISSAVPDELLVPNEPPYSAMLAIDFAICKDEDGGFMPRLIEMQGFPSLYFYQELLNKMYRKHFDIPDGYTNFFNGLEQESYLNLLKEVIVSDCDPENVVLLEIEPHKQKTFVDFVFTEKWGGIKPVCISDVIKKGSKLFYKKDGREVPIHRVYNRVIFDELIARDDIEYNFRFHDDLEVEWIAHPNWFFKISKYSLPFTDSEYVPKSYFLDDFDKLPEDLENYILKPLFSFAGTGIEFDVTNEIIEGIKNRSNYILQRKIEYAPVIETLDIPAKAEFRILLVWKDGYVPVNNLIRLSKGKMMGVDFNKNKTWVGSSIAYFEPD